MLAQLRALTRGWIARILLGVVALAMAITLFQGDFVRGVTGLFNPSGVADVGGQSITPRQFQREFDLFLRGQQRQGQTIARPDAIEAGLHLRLLDSMIQRRAMHHFAREAGVAVSDAQVAEALREIPAATDPITGRFNREAYFSFLNEVGYTPGEFETEMREDLAAGQLMQAATGGLRAPSSYGALILAFQSERRTVSVAEVTQARVGQIPAPTEPQVQAFYEDNAEAFKVPEFRALTIVLARPADFIARVSVPDERLREEFDRRSAALTQPERRTYVQLSSPDEAKARAAAQRLAAGEDPEAIARALGVTLLRQENKARNEVADSAVADAVFALAPGAAPQSVRGALTPFAAIRLESVTAAQTPRFEELRDTLRQEIALDEAAALMDTAIEAFDEARGAGGSLADAARAQGLAALIVPAVSAEGRGPDGAPIEAAAAAPALIEAAFETQEGEATDFMPLGEGVDGLVQVDRVIAETTRPLAEVRDQVIAGWTARERGRLMREIGDEIVAAVRGGQSFAAAAAAARVPVAAASQTLDRQTASRIPDRQLAQLVFSGQNGDVNLGLRQGAQALLLVHIESIERADLAQNRAAAENLRQQAQEQLTQSLIEAIEADAVRAARPRRNETLINQLFPTDQADQDSP